MRLRGRILRPSTLAERRLMTSLGVDFIRVPRKHNPFIVARRFERAARCETPDHQYLRHVVQKGPRPPQPSPEPDTAEPLPRDAA